MSLNQNIIDQCISLAGIAQSVRSVQHIAWKGQTNPTDLKAVVGSLLRVDASSAAAVYGGSFEVSTGLRLLSNQLDPQHRDKDPEFVSLMINVMTLQNQLSKNSTLMQTLTEEVNRLSYAFGKHDIYADDAMFEMLINRCSNVYQMTLSRLSNRIQVKGDPNFLKPEFNQSQVRAALLAAIRSCFLWRQSGGSRWHFLFKKKDLLAGFKLLLSNPIKE